MTLSATCGASVARRAGAPPGAAAEARRCGGLRPEQRLRCGVRRRADGVRQSSGAAIGLRGLNPIPRGWNAAVRASAVRPWAEPWKCAVMAQHVSLPPARPRAAPAPLPQAPVSPAWSLIGEHGAELSMLQVSEGSVGTVGAERRGSG